MCGRRICRMISFRRGSSVDLWGECWYHRFMTSAKDKSHAGGASSSGKSGQPAGDDLAAKVAQAKAQDEKKGELQHKIDELTAQVASLKDTAARAQAELQNAKIRMDRDANDLRKFAAE